MPVQVNVKVWRPVVFNAPVEVLLLVVLVPAHAPEALHAVAFVVLQVRVALPPVVTLELDVVNVTAGIGFGADEVAEDEVERSGAGFWKVVTIGSGAN